MSYSPSSDHSCFIYICWFYSSCSVCADFSVLLLHLHRLITILEMASPALCIIYILHLCDMYPLGSLLYISCSFNVVPQNLICCLDSFKEHCYAHSFSFFFFFYIWICTSYWLELWPHGERVLLWNILGVELVIFPSFVGIQILSFSFTVHIKSCKLKVNRKLKKHFPLVSSHLLGIEPDQICYNGMTSNPFDVTIILKFQRELSINIHASTYHHHRHTIICTLQVLEN